jgi:hypothetical protein
LTTGGGCRQYGRIKYVPYRLAWISRIGCNLAPLELAVNHFHPDRYSYRIQLRAQQDRSTR